MDHDAELPFSAAADRNKAPILEVLEATLPSRARVLEVACGTGQHAEHFARQHARWHWEPTDADPHGLAAVAARCAGLTNVAAPRQLDLLAPAHRPQAALHDAVFCANLLHISPWATGAALMALAAATLVPGGALLVYGPFEVEGEPLAAGNRAFDAELRSRDARWGLRRLGDVQREAAQAGLQFERRVAMPANNLLVVWRQGPAATGAAAGPGSAPTR
jgi:SAM-dependent methyltransferase